MQEVLKQRDAALLASMEALQEAAAAERLLKCLRSAKPDSTSRIVPIQRK